MHEVTYLRPVMEVDFSCILSISWSCSTVAVVAFGQRKSHDRQLANGNSIYFVSGFSIICCRVL